jgi:hypothetical protein
MKHTKLFEEFINEKNDSLQSRIKEITKLLKKQSFIGKVMPGDDFIKVFIDSDDIAVMMMWDEDEPKKIRMECDDDDLSVDINDDDNEILSYFENVNDSF